MATKKKTDEVPEWITKAEEAFLSKPDRLEKQADELEAQHDIELAKLGELQQKRAEAYANPDTPGIEIAGLDLDLQRLEPRVRRIGDRIPDIRYKAGLAQKAIEPDQRVAHAVADSLREKGLCNVHVVHDSDLTAPAGFSEPVTLVTQTRPAKELTKNTWFKMTEAEAEHLGWKVITRQNASIYGDAAVQVKKPSGKLEAAVHVRNYRPARPDGLTKEALIGAGWQDPDDGAQWDMPHDAARRAILAAGRDETSQSLHQMFVAIDPDIKAKREAKAASEAKAVATDDDDKAESDAEAKAATYSLFGVGGAADAALD